MPGFAWSTGGRVVVGSDAGELAELPGVDAADDLDEGRRAADLEADIEADLALRALPISRALRVCGTSTPTGFSQIGVLAASDHGFKMLDVEEGRRGDLDGVDVF